MRVVMSSLETSQTRKDYLCTIVVTICHMQRPENSHALVSIVWELRYYPFLCGMKFLWSNRALRNRIFIKKQFLSSSVTIEPSKRQSFESQNSDALFGL